MQPSERPADSHVRGTMKATGGAAPAVDAPDSDLDIVERRLSQLRARQGAPQPVPPEDASAEPKVPRVAARSKKSPSALPARRTGQRVDVRAEPSNVDEVVLEAARASGIEPAYVPTAKAPRRQRRKRGRRPFRMGALVLVLFLLVVAWSLVASSKGLVPQAREMIDKVWNLAAAQPSADTQPAPLSTPAAPVPAAVPQKTACEDCNLPDVTLKPTEATQQIAVAEAATQAATSVIPLKVRAVKTYQVSPDGKINFAGDNLSP
ncbi:MAG: hypothetical protein P4M09_08350 [Devosia sp.]|nr:hypothetical protein [Devosia sp.]